MFDSFPFTEWSTEIAEFWTFGGAGSTGTWIMLAVGLVFCVASLIGFVKMENGKLDRQAAVLRRSGGLDQGSTT
ncbi:MAG: hypothetical protein EXQ81_02165 [Thermoleophilia bacterium]|nr:hypothetical protein [Thermoleophilia bacterium]